jgi:hypothetical protein
MSIQMLYFTLLMFGLCDLYFAQSTSNITQEKNSIIYLDTRGARQLSFNAAPQFFFAYQTIPAFILNTASTTFVKVPGLSLVFYNARPRLFRISIQGHMYTNTPYYASLMKVMIDEHILISNKLLPNNDQRYGMASAPGFDAWAIDRQGGIISYTASPGMAVSGFKRENVYLPAGTHSIDVVVRTSKSVQVEGSELSVEVNDIPEGANINLPLLVPTVG